MKIKLLMLMCILSAHLNTRAQNVPVKSNVKVETKDVPEVAILNPLIGLKNEFTTIAKLSINENEKSVITLKAAVKLKNKQEIDSYRDKVFLYETRNNDLNNKMYAFNVVSGTLSEFNEFKKRWFLDLDALAVYEKNLKADNLPAK